MSAFKAYTTDPLNQEAVAQWQKDAQAHAGAAESKKAFAGKCLAFVMKNFNVAMKDAAAKTTVEDRMEAHNNNLTKPLTKKEKQNEVKLGRRTAALERAHADVADKQRTLVAQIAAREEHIAKVREAELLENPRKGKRAAGPLPAELSQPLVPLAAHRADLARGARDRGES